MQIIESAMARSRTVLLSLAVILLAGIVTYVSAPKEAEPDIEIPFIYISMTHDGISPEDAERLLVRPMEQELRGIEGIKELTASAYEGGANLNIEFDAGTDTFDDCAGSEGEGRGNRRRPRSYTGRRA